MAKTSRKHLTSSTFAAVFAEVSMKMRPCSRAKASPWGKKQQQQSYSLKNHQTLWEGARQSEIRVPKSCLSETFN